MSRGLKIVVIGLSLSSSWGNGHATTYRALLRALAARGHDILFLEQDQPWYAKHRDLTKPDFCALAFYPDAASLARFRTEIAAADAVIVGSYVPDGVAVGRSVQATARGTKAFYDIDTPVTLAKLAKRDFEYVSPELIRGYNLYLSFSAGPALATLMRRYGAPAAHALYCSVDPEAYLPVRRPRRYDLGYLGTYSADRQPGLERLLLAVARQLPDRRFVVAGPLYPDTIDWPENVDRMEHVPPRDHARFYGSCRFTLNVTRSDMAALGYSPSVRLFEAAACGTPVISDVWEGLDTLFVPGREIALAESTDDVLAVLTEWPERRRQEIARRARKRVLAKHTAAHRARELEELLLGRPRAEIETREGVAVRAGLALAS
jgi:spore maturation protein CgeB